MELSLRGALCRTSCCVTMSETLNDVEQAPEISKAMDLLIDIRQYKKNTSIYQFIMLQLVKMQCFIQIHHTLVKTWQALLPGIHMYIPL